MLADMFDPSWEPATPVATNLELGQTHHLMMGSFCIYPMLQVQEGIGAWARAGSVQTV